MFACGIALHSQPTIWREPTTTLGDFALSKPSANCSSVSVWITSAGPRDCSTRRAITKSHHSANRLGMAIDKKTKGLTSRPIECGIFYQDWRGMSTLLSNDIATAPLDLPY